MSRFTEAAQEAQEVLQSRAGKNEIADAFNDNSSGVLLQGSDIREKVSSIGMSGVLTVKDLSGTYNNGQRWQSEEFERRILFYELPQHHCRSLWQAQSCAAPNHHQCSHNRAAADAERRMGQRSAE
jgi:hypothetical protein